MSGDKKRRLFFALLFVAGDSRRTIQIQNPNKGGYIIEMKKSKMFKKGIALAIFTLLLFTSGCISHQSATHVKAFSLATTELSDQTIQIFELTDNSTIDRKIVEVALLTGNDLDKLNQKRIDEIKGILSNDKKAATSIKALNALKSYAKAIGDLSSADFKGDIDKASTELYGSLSSLEGTYKELTDKELGIKKEDFALFATLIDAIGTTIVEVKRRKAIKEIVVKTDPFVSRVCDEISNNIGIKKDIIRLNLSTVYSENIESYKKDIKSGEVINLEQKIRRIKELMYYSRVYHQSETIFEDIKKAVGKVKKAHNTLYKSVKKDKFTTPELAKEIGDLVSYSKEMRKFYEALLNPDKKNRRR